MITLSIQTVQKKHFCEICISFVHIYKRLCIVFPLEPPHHGRPKTVENKRSNVRYNKINTTFPDWETVENIIPRKMIINLNCASVDNHISRDDIFDYHPIRECNIYIIYLNSKLSLFCQAMTFLLFSFWILVNRYFGKQ